MKTIRFLLLSFLTLIGAGLIWRWLSQRRSLPCPTWLSGLVEGPLMDRVLGTQITLDRIDLQPGQRVLELGPGPGRLLIPAARRVQPGEAVGLDIQLGMIERLTARAALAGVSNLKAALGDATRANLPAESIDVVNLCTVLGEIPDRHAVLRQCYAALKPGGTLSITEIFPDPHYQTQATVTGLAEAAGFHLKEMHGPWYFFTANFGKPDGHLLSDRVLPDPGDKDQAGTLALLREGYRFVQLLRDIYRTRKQGQAAIEQRQRDRLTEMVSYARVHSPYYRELYRGLPERVEDPTLLPVTDKKKLMARFDDWVTDREVTFEKARPFVETPDLFGKQLLGKYLVITTSGTTGTLDIFLVDQWSLSVIAPLFLSMLSACLDVRDILRLIANGGRIASVLATGTPTATGVSFSRFGPRLGKAFQALPVHTPLPQLVAGLNRFQPVILMSYATVTKLLAREQEAGRLHIKPVLILLTAEGLAPDEYERIARAFNTRVANSYAASECPFMSANCKHGWLHVNADWIVLEPVDAGYRPVPPGTQSHTVLISNLANRVQPFLRYDLGDSVLMQPDPCPCGNRLPAIRVQGRAADVLTFPADRGERITLPPLLFGTLVYVIPGIEQFQVVQTAPTSLRVRLRPADGADPDRLWQAVQARLTHLLTEHHLGHVTVERAGEPPEQSPGGKYREVIPLS